MNEPSPKKPTWRKRFGWLVLIWLLSVMALAVVSFGLKMIMRAVGFHI
jgi:cytochrome c1